MQGLSNSTHCLWLNHLWIVNTICGPLVPWALGPALADVLILLAEEFKGLATIKASHRWWSLEHAATLVPAKHDIGSVMII